MVRERERGEQGKIDAGGALQADVIAGADPELMLYALLRSFYSYQDFSLSL